MSNTRTQFDGPKHLIAAALADKLANTQQAIDLYDATVAEMEGAMGVYESGASASGIGYKGRCFVMLYDESTDESWTRWLDINLDAETATVYPTEFARKPLGTISRNADGIFTQRQP